MPDLTIRVDGEPVQVRVEPSAAETQRQAALATTAAGALANMTLTVVKDVATIDIYTAELLPLSNRYVRTRLERIEDAPNRYDVWRHTETWLAERVDGAFSDIVQIASGGPPIMALEYGKTVRSGDGVEQNNILALFFADERRLGPSDTGTFTCRTFMVAQKGFLYEAEAADAGTGRAQVRSLRTFTSYGHRFDFEIESIDNWSMETLEVGNITVLGGSGSTFDLTLTGPAWEEDTFPPGVADRTDAETFYFYGPLGIKLGVAFEGAMLEGHHTNISAGGDFAIYWKDQSFAPALEIGDIVSGAVTYSYAWEGAVSSGVTSPVGPVSAFMRTVLDDADAATARDTLGLGALQSIGAVSSSTGAFEILGGTYLNPVAGTGRFYATAVDGLVIAGRGSTTDVILLNKSGAGIAGVPTGTTFLELYSKLKFATLPGDYADDAAAAASGIEVGEVYRNGSVLMVRAA